MPAPKTGEPIIREALERFTESQDGTLFSRQAYEDDTRFARLSDQWPEKVRNQRQEEGRPCLVINKLPALIRQVANESRQNKPSIVVRPVDNGADVATAEVINGLIRSIERNKASLAYDTAIDHALSGGFGFFEIGIEYAHDDTFDMECVIKRIPNALMVHWDPTTTAFDSSDWEFAFVSDLLTKEQFKQRYPKAEEISFEGMAQDDHMSMWSTDDELIRVAAYWLREEETRELILFDGPNGQVSLREDSLPFLAKQALQTGGINIGGQLKDAQLAQAYIQLSGLTELRRRTVKFHKVTRKIISGVEVLEGDGKDGEWPGSTIPICPVWGEEIILDGKRHFRSMIRDAKDPQAMHNFWRSATTELVALAPRAPFIMEEGSIPKGQEAKWQTANNRSHPFLTYTKGSQIPQRQPFAGVPAGALQEAVSANEDMQAITGIYPSSIGARSNETSGKAILTRERQGDISNFHFIDNLSRAIEGAGRILVEIIPSVYTERETIRILGDDMKEKVVLLGQQAGNQPTQDGQRLYDLSVGKYDVEVKTGPSYGTQREETRETLIELMRAVPQSASILGDVLIEHMDFQGADKVAKRLQMLLPPAIQKAEGIQGAQPAQPQVNPLDDEEKKAKIENLRAAAMASLAKAQATQRGIATDEMELVLKLLDSLQPSGIPGAPLGQEPQVQPGNPAVPAQA
jgi:hypothetical protein